MRALVAAAALASTFVLAAAAPAPAESLRHLNYRVSVSGAGAARSGTVHLDLVASRGEGAVIVDVAEELREADESPIRVDVFRGGGLATAGERPLSHSELTLLTVLALQSENIFGVDVGDEWTRDTAIPGGRASSRFKVLRNDGNGHVAMSLARTIAFADGEQSSWRGNVEYDANAFVPTAINLTGTVTQPRLQHVSVSLKLVDDSFASRVTR